MEQNGVKWTSSLLKGLGATSVAVPATNPSNKVKQFAAALSLAAVAAMASFAPNVSHAADAPSAAPAPIELAATYIYPDDVEPDPAPEGVNPGGYSSQTSQHVVDNPFKEKYTIAERERDYLDIANDTLNSAQEKVDNNAEAAADMPIFNNPVYKAYDAITSPLDTLVKLSTDEGSTANEYAQKAADITNVAVKYSTVGAGALVTDGIKVVQAGVAKVAEMRDSEHAQVQAAVDASRDRMARIYDEELQKMRAEDRSASAPAVANRVDVQKAASGGLETSNDGLENMFQAVPEKAGKYDNDKGLSR